MKLDPLNLEFKTLNGKTNHIVTNPFGGRPNPDNIQAIKDDLNKRSFKRLKSTLDNYSYKHLEALSQLEKQKESIDYDEI